MLDLTCRFILQPHDSIKKNLANKKKGAEEKIKNLEVHIFFRHPILKKVKMHIFCCFLVFFIFLLQQSLSSVKGF